MDVSAAPGTTKPREAAGPPGFFTRKATGLVREGRAYDALLYNVMNSSIALSFAFFFLLYGAFYNGSNALLAVLITAALALPGAFVYAMLSQIMPRTGGDYVFNSRALHPAIGFAGNATWILWVAAAFGIYTTYIAAYGVGAFSRMMAGFTGAEGWLDFGNWFSTKPGLFITGVAVLALAVGVFVLGGTRLFFKLQRGAFIVFAVGAILLPVAIGLLTSKGGFLANFNDYGANLGVENAAGALNASASEAGFKPVGFDLGATINSISIWWYIFGFLYVSNYFAGEIRLRKRTHMFSIPGALVVAVVTFLVLIPAFTHTVGYTFAGQMGVADPSAYGFAAGPPGYAELLAIAGGSPVLGAIILIGFTVGLVMWLPQAILMLSRGMFAWSFDRIMPQKLSYVSPRTHTPVVAIAVVALLGLASTAIWSFTDWLTGVSIILPLTAVLGITCLSAVVLPYRHPAMVENSPYSRRIAGIPMLSLVGALGLIGNIVVIVVLLSDPGSGASLEANPGKAQLAVLSFVVFLAIYFISQAVRRRQGIDLALANRELPPE
jgi:amino acid transporter